MARPRSEDKRNAILAAATEVVGTLGPSAPTARISRAAGVAEGTLFTYFEDKDALLNELYLELKRDLRNTMMEGYPASASLADRARHVWGRYVDWGVAHPAKHRAVTQLAVSDRVTARTREVASAMFAEVDAMLHGGRGSGALADQPPAFVSAILTALAETTMGFVQREPASAEQYKRAGFDAFWRAVAKE
ncbi:MAG TPA: TetR/AcrR family transcriptional regulator [Longimicrobium sp.]|nr:TetR/AcrR family transcriptional regulator [Longimicrobium sp.]